ncbi:hypothetical protein CHS0354_008954 [Potamilus streckersoni]|uniref:Inter-alpha-trypsin inhibitor heavy chain H3-like n=1 Tax=Potamilus streckersoni TaxID=2493646 RepID=A0AAE0THK2_9BIVA|nr:hypothetical protein CHS0354_008954 [Potamilus streckersoni]
MYKTGLRIVGVRWTCYVVVGFLMFHGVHSQDTYNDKPVILSLHISSDIKYRFATTLIVNYVKNPYKVAKEIVFDVTLPNEAFITDFKMEIDGTVYPGEIKEKEQAKTQYEAARSRGESAAHIKERPRETNKFDIQVNVAAETKVTFNLTYQELLRRKRGLYHHVVYIDPGQPVEDMNVRIHIQESRKISVVRVPALGNDINKIQGIATNNLVLMARPSPNSAFIQFAPTIQQQIDNDQNGISGQFVVEYDIERSHDAGEILVVHGYFVHFFAPSGFEPFPNDVLFILDESGSMFGRKIKQVKDAMAAILSDLHEDDRINIVTFSDHVNFWRNEMINCTEENILKAKEFISGRNASGLTNINEALLDGIKHLSELNVSEFRTPMIVFLTDGDATKGETNSERIMENIENVNEKGVIPIFTLAFGQDADYDLLKKISSRNNGVARKIYEASDAELQISGFYDEISAALMTDLVFHYLDGSVDNATVTKSHFNRYFDGSEMAVAGKMGEEETKTLPIQVIGNSRQGITFLNFDSDILEFADFTNMTTVASIENITEKMWAYLTIKQTVEKLNSAADADQKESLRASALALSLKYKFVTPLTSMVVSKPQTQGEGISNLVYLTRYEDETKSTSFRGNVPSLHSRKSFHHWPVRHLSLLPRYSSYGISYLRPMGGYFGPVFRSPDPPKTHHRTSSGGHRKKQKSPKAKTNGATRKKWERKQKNISQPKMYPIRIKYNNTTYATCFNIPGNESYDSYQPLQLLHSPDGIAINADVGAQAKRDYIIAVNVTINSTVIEIDTTAISILQVNNRHNYNWGSHDLLLPEVKLHVEPSSVKVEAEGLNILIYKIGNPSKGLGLFMNETSYPLYSSPTGLLATLLGGKSSPYGITFSGPAAVFAAYTLTDLSETDTWHGDSKCYTVQSNYLI